MDAFEVLGQTIVKQATGPYIVGASAGGFDSSFLIDAASELAKRGVSSYEADQASTKSKADAAAQLSKAIAADANWANAETMLELANQSHDPSRVAPAQALQSSAMSTALSVGAGLPPDAVAKRVATAQDAANKAAQDALANPHDTLKAATMKAWQKVVAAAGASSGALTAGGKAGGHFGAAGGNWLTKKFGPLPVWGWGAVGVGAIVGTVLVVKMLRR